MARKPSLSDAVAEPAPVAAPAAAAVTSAPIAARAPSRAGRKGVAFWIDPEAARQLRILSAEEETTVQALMEEALDLLFYSRGKQRIARKTK